MPANSWGERFVCTTFGESHGPGLGVVIDGCPAGVEWDQTLLERELQRRRPGGELVSARNEADAPEVLSGVYENKTLGTPIAILVRNQDARSQDYEKLPPRRGHADDVWLNKFDHSDPRGGGRASGRETVARVLAGGVARMALNTMLPELKIFGYASQIGPITLEEQNAQALRHEADKFPARLPSPQLASQVEELLKKAKAEGQSYGGIAEIAVVGAPRGLGQPVFNKLKSDWAAALMSVGATSALEIGEGLATVQETGTDFHSGEMKVYGGIRGGISTGEELRARIHFKPTSSFLDVAKRGRHDPCIVPRAIPVLEAMTALVLMDHLLWSKTDKAR